MLDKLELAEGASEVVALVEDHMDRVDRILVADRNLLVLV